MISMKRSSSYEKGRRYEYKLMEELKKRGFFVIRSPASGRRSKRFFYPDIVAIRKKRILIVESKMYSDKRGLYIPKNQWKKLKWIQNITGGEAYVSVYYKDIAEFILVHIDTYDKKTERYYVWSRKSVIEKGRTIDELVREC